MNIKYDCNRVVQFVVTVEKYHKLTLKLLRT